MVSLFTLCYWRKAAADGLKNGWNREILMKSSWRAVLKKRKNWPFNACFCVNDKTIRPVIRQGFWPRHNSSLSTPKRKEIIYYSLTRLCIFGYITRASQKWRKQLLRYSVRAYLLLLSSWKSIPGHPPTTFFLFPLVLPSQTAEFWLGSRGSWTSSFVLFFFLSAGHLHRTYRGPPFSFGALRRINMGFGWISIRTHQSFLCGYNEPGSLLIVPPLLSLSYSDERMSVSGIPASDFLYQTSCIIIDL